MLLFALLWLCLSQYVHSVAVRQLPRTGLEVRRTSVIYRGRLQKGLELLSEWERLTGSPLNFDTAPIELINHRLAEFINFSNDRQNTHVAC